MLSGISTTEQIPISVRRIKGNLSMWKNSVRPLLLLFGLISDGTHRPHQQGEGRCRGGRHTGEPLQCQPSQSSAAVGRRTASWMVKHDLLVPHITGLCAILQDKWGANDGIVMPLVASFISHTDRVFCSIERFRTSENWTLYCKGSITAFLWCPYNCLKCTIISENCHKERREWQYSPGNAFCRHFAQWSIRPLYVLGSELRHSIHQGMRSAGISLSDLYDLFMCLVLS